MISTSAKKFEEEGILALDHQITLDGVVLLEIEEYLDPEPYYTINWLTNLSDEAGYKFVLEMYMALKKTHPNPLVTYSFRKTREGVPLEQFLNKHHKPHFNSRDFSLLRIDARGENTDGTAIVYDRVTNPKQPELGLISNYDLSRIIPPFLKRSFPFAERIDEKEVEVGLHRILGKYKSLPSQ